MSSPIGVWIPESREGAVDAGLAPKPTWAAPMIRGGLLGLFAATAPVIASAVFMQGVRAAVTAAVASLIVGAFFVIGQLVEAFALRMTDFRGFGLVLLSYTVRIAALGVVLLVALANPEFVSSLPLTWFALGALAGVVGWLGGFLLAHSRQRIPIYDEPVSSAQGGAQ